jgi:hypothetical protein
MDLVAQVESPELTEPPTGATIYLLKLGQSDTGDCSLQLKRPLCLSLAKISTLLGRTSAWKLKG